METIKFMNLISEFASHHTSNGVVKMNLRNSTVKFLNDEIRYLVTLDKDCNGWTIEAVNMQGIKCSGKYNVDLCVISSVTFSMLMGDSFDATTKELNNMVHVKEHVEGMRSEYDIEFDDDHLAIFNIKGNKFKVGIDLDMAHLIDLQKSITVAEGSCVELRWLEDALSKLKVELYEPVKKEAITIGELCREIDKLDRIKGMNRMSDSSAAVFLMNGRILAVDARDNRVIINDYDNYNVFTTIDKLNTLDKDFVIEAVLTIVKAYADTK